MGTELEELAQFLRCCEKIAYGDGEIVWFLDGEIVAYLHRTGDIVSINTKVSELYNVSSIGYRDGTAEYLMENG